MKTTLNYSLLFCFVFLGCFSYSQEIFNGRNQKVFTIKGFVYDKKTRAPFANVNVQVIGGSFTKTSFDGKFTIKVKIDDELIISHNEFQTIHHVITSDDRINIEVEDDEPEVNNINKKIRSAKLFKSTIDSAKLHLKSDASKSIKFIGDALGANINSNQRANAYELLGDIYQYWKQYDLAISAYASSIQNAKTNSLELKLANSYLKNGEYQKSISALNNINVKKLNNYKKVELYEILGDANLKLNFFETALEDYNKGLAIAQKNLITPKITDLNSKIAEAYNKKGNKAEAKNYFNNSLSLAKKENRQRAVLEQAKVADFNNLNEDYDSEISLRKETVKTIKDIEKDSVFPNDSPLTIQKQNYKIGNAYLQKNDYDKAIPYLEKSEAEANDKDDLEVQSDALRVLSEAHFNKGDTAKGLETIDNYKSVIDELYVKKRQEIAQAARFSKNIAEQQNRIASLESDRALSLSRYELSKERNKSQQLIIYSLIGGLILLLITIYFTYKYIRQQKIANNLLALKSLRSQMNPHFIFNALNSVNSFIANNDERTANKYLTDFSHLMRSVLENSEEDFIPLKKEIELIEVYTKLEHFRFQDKFDYDITINSNLKINDFLIPPMLLQPYIENAVWHGLRYKKTKGHLIISIQPKNKNQLVVTITDDGIGRMQSKAIKTEHQKKQNSKGMSNIKERVHILNKMYKDKVTVEITDLKDEPDVGTKVVITINKK